MFYIGTYSEEIMKLIWYDRRMERGQRWQDNLVVKRDNFFPQPVLNRLTDALKCLADIIFARTTRPFREVGDACLFHRLCTDTFLGHLKTYLFVRTGVWSASE